MTANKPDNDKEFTSSFQGNAADTQLVTRMRIVLAVSVMLAVFVDPLGLSAVGGFTWIIFYSYFIYSIVIYINSQLNKSISRSVIIQRLDVLWFTLIVIFTGGVNSFFFLFYFFVILTSSFRWGFEEGTRITIASAILFAASGFILLNTKDDISRLLLRTTFLLVIGYLSVHWGESKVRLVQQLALLRDVCRLSNPRFGVEHTVVSVLKNIRSYYKASSCILILYNKDLDYYSLRTIKENNTSCSMKASIINSEIALSLMGFSHIRINLYARAFFAAISSYVQESLIYDSEETQWKKENCEASEGVAELLGCRSFISTPLSLMRQQGRIYITSEKYSFNKTDALFLHHIAAQVFPVIENIELLDKMASQAALQERNKISLDIHDTAIQPYIGLKLGLGSLRNKALIGNPLILEIDKLILMTEQVVDDLRRFAVTFTVDTAKSESILLVILNQQARQFREFYGIDINIKMARELVVSDRLATEVLQFVREGLSNVCKHTESQKCLVEIKCVNNVIIITIENEYTGMKPMYFTPRSINKRAVGLGGKVYVNQGPNQNTIVNVVIPL